jgi:hypothetical protein
LQQGKFNFHYTGPELSLTISVDGMTQECHQNGHDPALYFQGSVLDEHEEEMTECNKYHSFWVSWYDGIQVGRGIYPGQNEFLKHEGDPKYHIHSVSLTTGFGSDGHWAWPLQSGNYFFSTVTYCV